MHVPRLRVSLPLILGPLLLLAPVWLTGRALFWGTPFLQFVPWRWTAWEMLRAGQLPLWNPGVGMGAPLAANYQSALFYPPNWLQFLLAAVGGVGWLAWGQALLVSLHLAWAANGAARLARQAGLGDLAQVVCGLAFGLSGYLVARSGFLSINAAAAWLPWVLLVASKLASQAPRGLPGANRAPGRFAEEIAQIFKLGFVLGMQLLAGHAQTAWYTLLLVGLWTGFLGWRTSSRAPLGERAAGLLRVWTGLSLALLLALLLAAVQLLPTAEYLLQSQRSGSIGYEFAMTYSFWPWRFLTLLAPDLFGNPAHGDYLGYGNYWEDAVYIGMLPFLMAAGSAFSLVALGIRSLWNRRQAPGSRAVVPRGSTAVAGETAGRLRSAVDGRAPAAILFWILIVLVSFSLALGVNTPLFPWLYRNVPTFALFQGPTRFSLWAELGLALLAGYGVDAWQRPTGRGLYWTRLGTAGAFAVTLGAGLAWYFLGDIRPTFLRATALAGLWGLGTGILSLLAPPKTCRSPSESDEGAPLPPAGRYRISPGGAWSWAVILFVSADLLAAGWGLNPGIGLDLYTYPAPTAAALAGQGRLYLPKQDEYRIKFDRFFRFKTFQPGEDWNPLRAVLLPDAFLLDALESVNNFDPLVPGRYARWMEALEQANPAVQERLLNLMGVGVVVKVDLSNKNSVRFETRSQSRRLRWVPCAMPVASPEEALAWVLAGPMDPQWEVVVEAPGDDPAPLCTEMALSHPIPPVEPYILTETPDRLVARVQADAPGWLVLSDVWYPGWQTEVDGRAVPMRRADYLFRAIPIPAGEHVVTFVYRPASFFLGALLSLAAWGALVFLAAVRQAEDSTLKP